MHRCVYPRRRRGAVLLLMRNRSWPLWGCPTKSACCHTHSIVYPNTAPLCWRAGWRFGEGVRIRRFNTGGRLFPAVSVVLPLLDFVIPLMSRLGGDYYNPAGTQPVVRSEGPRTTEARDSDHRSQAETQKQTLVWGEFIIIIIITIVVINILLRHQYSLHDHYRGLRVADPRHHRHVHSLVFQASLSCLHIILHLTSTWSFSLLMAVFSFPSTVPLNTEVRRYSPGRCVQTDFPFFFVSRSSVLLSLILICPPYSFHPSPVHITNASSILYLSLFLTGHIFEP